MTGHDVCKKAIEAFGINSQIWKTVEECAELIDALAKWKGARCDSQDVITEIADVKIMIEQLSIFFGEKDVCDEQVRKLQRLEKRINDKMKEDV